MMTPTAKRWFNEAKWFPNISRIKGIILELDKVRIYVGTFLDDGAYLGDSALFIEAIKHPRKKGLFVAIQTTKEQRNIVKELIKNAKTIEDATKIIFKKGGKEIAKVDWE